MKTDLERFRELFDSVGLEYTETILRKMDLRYFKILLKVEGHYGDSVEVVFTHDGKIIIPTQD